MNLLIMGGPGAGKGTQAERIIAYYRIAHISTGDMFREAIAAKTANGLRLKTYLDSGALVPDEVTNALVADRLLAEDCHNGFLLDGYPRTIAQAEALDALMASRGQALDKVILIDVADDILVGRISGRWICPKCGASFHEKTRRPKVEGRCDVCGTALVQRKDDTPETALNRIAVYHTQTEPVLSYYEAQGLVLRVDGTGSIEDIFNRIEKGIGGKAC